MQQTVDEVAGSIAKIRRAEDRQHQVRPAPEPVVRQRLPEIRAVPVQPTTTGDVEQPAEAGCRIDHEPNGRGGGALQMQLQELVEQDRTGREMPKHAPNRRLDGLGHEQVIELGGRIEKQAIDDAIDAQSGTVHGFQRIREAGRR